MKEVEIDVTPEPVVANEAREVDPLPEHVVVAEALPSLFVVEDNPSPPLSQFKLNRVKVFPKGGSISFSILEALDRLQRASTRAL